MFEYMLVILGPFAATYDQEVDRLTEDSASYPKMASLHSNT